MRTFRLWKSKVFGPPIGLWVWGNYCMKRLLPSGDYEYREMTEQEAEDYLSVHAW